MNRWAVFDGTRLLGMVWADTRSEVEWEAHATYPGIRKLRLHKMS